MLLFVLFAQDLEPNDWEILYIEMAKYIKTEPKYTDEIIVN